MRIIKLDAIDSTNSYLRQWSNKEALEDYTVVSAKSQTKGRGQMGAVWDTEPAKNLTVSVFKDISFLDVEQQFYVSIVVALAIKKTFKYFGLPKVKVKWPNDILSDSSKVCGVLIENVIKQNELKGCIIGIGINVNQTNFEQLPKASSMGVITGKHFDLDEVLITLVSQLKDLFQLLKDRKFEILMDRYENALFRKKKPSTFKNAKGDLFTGIIKGVTSSGNLVVLLEDEVIEEFELKQISLLY
ncbi:MAG: biotin--[acetyl-CoA-carboxylase] ligase [Bacteroidetes bacterium MedPE-SWsnd-G2]|nr:MAG: biotin--[acetyl-CoA-carboxylase] ligase [Bacteroidetes bacterium MedPE-SWsnd-G2]